VEWEPLSSGDPPGLVQSVAARVTGMHEGSQSQEPTSIIPAKAIASRNLDWIPFSRE